MNETLHVRIVKDYASDIINDLKNSGAVQLLSDEEIIEIPEWQKDEVLKAKAWYRLHPEELLTWDHVFNKLK